jgi:hypothetical protein
MRFPLAVHRRFLDRWASTTRDLFPSKLSCSSVRSSETSSTLPGYYLGHRRKDLGIPKRKGRHQIK